MPKINEAIYLRWVNAQVNYANYQAMQEMTRSLKEIFNYSQKMNIN